MTPLPAILLLTALQSAEPMFRSEAVDAHIDVQVTQGGKAVAGLRASDFVVERGATQVRVTHLAAEEQALDVLLVLDVSRSMQQWLEMLAEDSHAALSLMRADDRIAVATFSEGFKVRAQLSHDLRTAAAAVTDAAADRSGHLTKLDDAIHQSAQYMAKRGRPDARRAVIFVTDNLSPGDRDARKLMTEVLTSEAVYNALLPPAEKGRISLRSTTSSVHSDIRRYVEATHGESITSSVERGPALRDCLQRLRTRYTLYYRPDASARDGQLTVELTPSARDKHPDAQVRFPMRKSKVEVCGGRPRGRSTPQADPAMQC